MAIYKVHIPRLRGNALIFTRPTELNKDINSERVGKFKIESAKYSYAAKLVVKRFAIFGNSPFR